MGIIISINPSLNECMLSMRYEQFNWINLLFINILVTDIK